MEENQTQQPKFKSKKKKIAIILIIDFIVALIANGLSLLKTYDPNVSCQPPECLGQHASVYYGYPFKFLYFKPAGFSFYFDKFFYNFVIYLSIIIIISFILLLIFNKKKR